MLEELGLTLALPTLDAWAGQVEMLAGDPTAAEHIWRRAYQTLEGLGEKGNLSTIAAFRADALYALGRDSDAMEMTTVSEATASVDDVTSHIAWRTVRAKVAARRGDYEEGERLAREAVARAEETDWPNLRGGAFEALSAVMAASGRSDQALAAAERALEVYEEKGNLAAAGALRRALQSD